MERVPGRPRKDRLRAMRFALWAVKQAHTPTSNEIATLLNISSDQARRWRRDWLEARSPTQARGSR